MRIKSRSARYVGASDICGVDHHVYDAAENNAGKSEPGDGEEFEG